MRLQDVNYRFLNAQSVNQFLAFQGHTEHLDNFDFRLQRPPR